METQILNARPIVDNLKIVLKEHVTEMVQKGIRPHLKIVLIGKDPASKIYVNNKKKLSVEIGAECSIVELDERVSQKECADLLTALSHDNSVHGILLQLPTPPHLNSEFLISCIAPEKDVDGLTPYNLGQLMNNSPLGPRPCTPKGIIKILDFYGVDLLGINALVIGRGHITGKPMFLELLHRSATVTLAHSKSKDIKSLCKAAELIIVAVGKINFLTADFLDPKKRPVVIDVGIHRTPSGTLEGDVHFSSVAPLCSKITPVPGGVGPLTVLGLAENLIMAAKNQKVINGH